MRTILLNTKRRDLMNFGLLALVVAFYVGAQILFGTRNPSTGGWTFSTPIDEDILYYAAVANQIAVQIPPQNPVYAGVTLFQSWLPMVPVSWLAPTLGPYVAMRVLNVGYVLFIAYLFCRYFRDYWGLLSAILLITLSLKFRVPSFGTDAIFKGFYHLPSYIAFLVIWREHKQWLRVPCLVVLPWLHALSAIPIFLFLAGRFALNRDTRSLQDAVICFAGFVIYTSILSNPDATPGYKLLLEGLSFNPLEPFLHTVVWTPFLWYCRNKDLWILFAVSFGLATLVQWQPFPWIYMLEFCTALMVVDGLRLAPIKVRTGLLVPVVSLTICLFILYVSVIKFSRDAPLDIREYKQAMEWVASNTPRAAVFLVAPQIDVADTADMPMIIQVRQTYYGARSLVKGPGEDPDEARYNAVMRAFEEGVVPPEVGFVFYGPVERRRFPDFKEVGCKVYGDSWVTIYDVRSEPASQTDEPQFSNSSTKSRPHEKPEPR